MEMEFHKIIPEMPQANINTTAASEDVAEIEQRIRVIKERCRATLSTLPFKMLPNIMTINLVCFSVFWVNAMPVKSGISTIFSPRELICHQKVDAKKCCKLLFGEYVKMHEEPTITNSMQARMRPAICLGPTGNFQGSIKFMCVETGLKIVIRNYTKLPMPDSVIKKVNLLKER